MFFAEWGHVFVVSGLATALFRAVTMGLYVLVAPLALIERLRAPSGR